MNTRLPRALLFDLDGLLLDTETLARNSFTQACEEIGWKRIDLEIYRRCIGHHGYAIERILKDGYGDDFPWDEIKPRFQYIYHHHIEYHPVDVKPGAVDLLTYAQELALPCAIATSSHLQTAKSKLNLTDLSQYFSAVVSADDVSNGKPNPEPYLKAAKLIGESPHLCWAMEDSPTGVQAAVAAGCQVFQIPDLVPPTEQIRKLGHRIVDSLYDVIAALKAVT